MATTYRWKVLSGKHIQKENGRPRVYRAGDVVETDKDLGGIFNQPPTSIKFERLPDDHRAAVAPRPAEPVGEKPPAKTAR